MISCMLRIPHRRNESQKKRMIVAYAKIMRKDFIGNGEKFSFGIAAYGKFLTIRKPPEPLTVLGISEGRYAERQYEACAE